MVRRRLRRLRTMLCIAGRTMRPENNGILRDAAKGRPSSNNGEAVVQGMRTKQDGR